MLGFKVIITKAENKGREDLCRSCRLQKSLCYRAFVTAQTSLSMAIGKGYASKGEARMLRKVRVAYWWKAWTCASCITDHIPHEKEYLHRNELEDWAKSLLTIYLHWNELRDWAGKILIQDHLTSELHCKNLNRSTLHVGHIHPPCGPWCAWSVVCRFCSPKATIVAPNFDNGPKIFSLGCLL